MSTTATNIFLKGRNIFFLTLNSFIDINIIKASVTEFNLYGFSIGYKTNDVL